MICKLDIEKAYDSVNWEFLFYVMRRMGFGEKWCQWMKFYVSTVHLFVLVNGTPAGFFSTSRGLRQGDPLSPLLFLLVMEAFTRLLGRAVDEGLLEGSVGSVGRGVVSVSHLLYADDALVFCEPRAEQLGYLRCVLLCFETVSGLRVNLSKSELIPVGEVDRVPMLAVILGCKVSALPVSYLGLPLGATFKAQGVWNGVVERV